MNNVAVIYSSPKMGDPIWQLPYIKAISKFENKKVFLYFHKKVQIKKYLKLLNYIEKTEYNGFNKGINFFYDLIKLKKSFEKNSIKTIYLLEKTKCALIAAIFAGVKKRISYGVGIQKILLTNKNFLNKQDLKFNYTVQSEKFLKINNIPIFNKSPELRLPVNYRSKKKLILTIVVDSTEDNRNWPKENFACLVGKILNLNFFNKINIISHPHKFFIADYIIKKNNFNKILKNCSQFSFEKAVDAIAECSIFLSVDTGPPNLAAAFGIPTIVIIGPTDESALRSPNMIKILSNYYDKSREEGIKRHGDNFDKTNKEVCTISVNKVLNVLKKLIKRKYVTKKF